jgi:hypothetical protein
MVADPPEHDAEERPETDHDEHGANSGIRHEGLNRDSNGSATGRADKFQAGPEDGVLDRHRG